METVAFRKLEKEILRGRVPASLESWVRNTAHRRRTSISAVLTECVAIAKGDDPQVYGIKPGRRKQSPANQA